MKKILIFSILLILPISILFARTGGPDVYGYIFQDSDESGVTFDWVDTSGATIVPFAPGDDDESLTVVLPFQFRFYGILYDSVWVSTNGLLAFLGENSDEYSNDSIPNETVPNAFIAPLWDDQKLYDTDTITDAIFVKSGGDAPNRWVAFIWFNFFRYGFFDDTWTYEVILYENPDNDGDIAIQYLDAHLDGSYADYGASATVGIENDDGTIGLQYSYNDSALSDSLRIEFTKPSPVNHDIALTGILQPEGTVINIFDVSPTVLVRNYGITDEPAANIHCTITGITSGTVYDVDTTISIDSGTMDTVQFPVWSDFDADSYTIEFIANVPSDERPENDTLISTFEGLVHIGFGGPDDIGYVWYDNFYDGDSAPEFTGIDLSDATPIDLSGDDELVGVEIPFDFDFYGTTFDSVWITTNGIIAFGEPTYAEYFNTDLPTSSFDGAVAPFWDDLYVDTAATPPSRVYTATGLAGDGRQTFRIIYENIYIRFIDKYLTCEITLYENGDIEFQYTGFSDVYDSQIMGSSATVGISSPDGTIGLMYEYNWDPAYNPVMNDFAIYFYAPTSFVDTIPPQIAFTPDTIYWLCAADSFSLTLDADITDFSGVAAETLYYDVSGTIYSVIPDTVIGDTYYFTLRNLVEGENFGYYFVASDGYGNSAKLPADAPDSMFSAFVGNPHQGGDPYILAFVDNFGTSDYPPPPVFEWTELDPAEGGSGIALDSISDDWISEPIGTTYWCGLPVFFKICSNGWITFDTSYTGADRFGSIPDTTEPNKIIAPLWTDLTPTPPDDSLPVGQIFYLIEGDNFWVEWKNFYLYGDYSGIPFTFEFHCYTYADGYVSIGMDYLSIPTEIMDDITIGVENDLFMEYILAYINESYPPICMPMDSSAVLFYNDLIGISEKVPARASIGAPYPNPFNSSTEIEIELPYSQSVSAEILTIDGRKISSVIDEKLSAGKHKLLWRPNKNTPSGIYYIRIKTGDNEYIRKAVLIK